MIRSTTIQSCRSREKQTVDSHPKHNKVVLPLDGLFRDVLHTVPQMRGSQLLAFTNTNVYLAKINWRPFFPPQTGAAVRAYCLSSVPKDITAGRHPVFCVKIAVSFCDQWFAAAAAGFLLRLQPNVSLCVCEQYEIFSDQRRELTPSIPHTCGHNLNAASNRATCTSDWNERSFNPPGSPLQGFFIFISVNRPHSFLIVWPPSANQLHLLFFSLPDFCEAKQKKRSVQIQHFDKVLFHLWFCNFVPSSLAFFGNSQLMVYFTHPSWKRPRENIWKT